MQRSIDRASCRRDTKFNPLVLGEIHAGDDNETIRGHVSCSFLALVLKKELEDRIATLGHASSWPNVLADLDSLTETEVEQDGKRFLLRTPPRPAASLALRAAGVALPPTVRQLADA